MRARQRRNLVAVTVAAATLVIVGLQWPREEEGLTALQPLPAQETLPLTAPPMEPQSDDATELVALLPEEDRAEDSSRAR
ncbi:MAG: hypothetical protein AAF368_17435, partial [Planctomycetota bacterium]